MTKTELLGRIATARAGDRIMYHLGFLLSDKETHDSQERDRLETLADAALDAYRAGKVMLFQRRVVPHIFEYIAMKLPAPYKQVEWVGCYAKADDYYGRPKRKKHHAA